MEELTALVRRVQNGDTDAYNTIVIRFQDMVAFLLSRGSKTNLPNDEPWADRRGHTTIADILRRHGATK